MTTLDEMFKSKRPHTYGDVTTIDPGLGGTGWAYWGALKRDGTTEPPDKHGVIRPEKAAGRSLTKRICSVTSQFDNVDLWWSDIVVIEDARLWSGNEKSQASAERGDLLKLVMLIGAIVQYIGFHTEVVLVPAHTWKGQLDKRAVHARIRRALGKKYREHEADAVGIGLAMQGVL